MATLSALRPCFPPLASLLLPLLTLAACQQRIHYADDDDHGDDDTSVDDDNADDDQVDDDSAAADSAGDDDTVEPGPPRLYVESDADAHLYGTQSEENSGHWISIAADIQGDGRNDVLIGAYGHDGYADVLISAQGCQVPAPQIWPGDVYLFYGGPDLWPDGAPPARPMARTPALPLADIR